MSGFPETPDSERDLLSLNYGPRVSIVFDDCSIMTSPPRSSRSSFQDFSGDIENRNLLTPHPPKHRYPRKRITKSSRHPSFSFIPLIVCASTVVIFTLLLILGVILFGGCYFN